MNLYRVELHESIPMFLYINFLRFVLGTEEETRTAMPTTHVTRQNRHKKHTPNGRLINFFSNTIIYLSNKGYDNVHSFIKTLF